ncbi:hypothetical protein F5Y06DRAFT_9760 [Hypoxylon sp. FL0890]|nr:hypothetical protein F5Y06DRAFT_9760 [Hypoxylon sp. FL0890]
MADNKPDIQAILAALAAQSGPSSTTPSQGQAAFPMPTYQQNPTPTPSAYNTMPPMPPMTNQPLPHANYPVDLSAIRPVTSGTVNLGDAIAQAKSYAAERGLTPYDRHSEAYQHDPRSSRQYRSRSRSPPARRDAFRDNVNPYRDERRNDRGVHARDREYVRDRDRSQSPDDSEIISVESSLVGLIIGRQGENLRRVESETECRVQFLSPTGEPGYYRQCKITGPKARRTEAKAAIYRIIDDSGMGALARAGLDKQPHPRRETPNPNALREGEDHMKIMVPDRTVGLIIGRGGETIRDLQERSGCHINIVGEDQSVDGLRPVNLIGPTAATTQAKELILEIVASDSRNGHEGNKASRPQRTDHGRDSSQGGPDKINDSIYVPSEAVGMIIGKGGETIKEMVNTTGCKINVTASSGPNEVQREIGLVGSRDAINRAKHAIEDKVEAVRQKNAGGANQGRSGRGQHRREWDNSNPNPSYPPQQQNQATEPAPAAGGVTDPYAPYGGYESYLALWYHAYAAQQPGSQPGDAPQPPGI